MLNNDFNIILNEAINAEVGDSASASMSMLKRKHDEYLNELNSVLQKLANKVHDPRHHYYKAAQHLSLKISDYKLYIKWKYKAELMCWPDLINSRWVFSSNIRKNPTGMGNSLPLEAPLDQIADVIINFFVDRYTSLSGREEV